MKLKILSLLLWGIVLASARYILVPIKNIQLMGKADHEGLIRVIRSPQESWDSQPAQDGRIERQASHDHHAHVDYGAHTGHHGAFGWYADFPVTTHH